MIGRDGIGWMGWDRMEGIGRDGIGWEGMG